MKKVNAVANERRMDTLISIKSSVFDKQTNKYVIKSDLSGCSDEGDLTRFGIVFQKGAKQNERS